MNDPRRVAAQKELRAIVHRIQSNLKFDGNAGYYLHVLPPILKELEAAYETLIVTEATVEAEVTGKTGFHTTENK